VYTLDPLNNSAEGLRIRYPCCWSLARATRIRDPWVSLRCTAF